MTNIEKIKQIREKFGLGLMESRNLLGQFNGDLGKVLRDYKAPKLKDIGLSKFGAIFTYCHNGRIGVMVDLRCQTDFASRTSTFKSLGHNLCLQLASMEKSTTIKQLLDSQYIRDDSLTVREFLNFRAIALKENLKIHRVIFWSLS